MDVFVCPSDHRHGENLTCYTSHACRCRPCRDRAAKVNRDRYRLKAYGQYEPTKVDSSGTVRRLRALVARGWSLAHLARHLGSHRQDLRLSLQRQLTSVEFAARVARMYDTIWDQAPPAATPAQRSALAKAKLWALREGWAPPLAWDDDTIDDPAAVPDMDGVRRPEPAEPFMTRFDESVVDAAIAGEQPRLSPLERRAVITELNARAWSAARIAEWIRCNPKTIVRVRVELNLPVPDQTTIRSAA